MEPLKLFATYESLAPLPEQASYLHGAGWRAMLQHDRLECHREGMNLSLEASGAGLFLLRGEVERSAQGDRAKDGLLEILRRTTEVFQLDVFEEDGRLTRRYSSAD